jgi:hypothetical protein
MKSKFTIAAALLAIAGFTSCTKDVAVENSLNIKRKDLTLSPMANLVCRLILCLPLQAALINRGNINKRPRAKCAI